LAISNKKKQQQSQHKQSLEKIVEMPSTEIKAIRTQNMRIRENVLLQTHKHIWYITKISCWSRPFTKIALWKNL